MYISLYSFINTKKTIKYQHLQIYNVNYIVLNKNIYMYTTILKFINYQYINMTLKGSSS